MFCVLSFLPRLFNTSCCCLKQFFILLYVLIWLEFFFNETVNECPKFQSFTAPRSKTLEVTKTCPKRSDWISKRSFGHDLTLGYYDSNWNKLHYLQLFLLLYILRGPFPDALACISFIAFCSSLCFCLNAISSYKRNSNWKLPLDSFNEYYSINIRLKTF